MNPQGTTLAGAPAHCSEHPALRAAATRIEESGRALLAHVLASKPGAAYLELLTLAGALEHAQCLLSSQYSEHVLDALIPETAEVAATCTDAEVDAYAQRLRVPPSIFNRVHPSPTTSTGNTIT